MDETRKLLDSLMGNSRNASSEEAKKTKGENFKKDNVCKGYLLGFCPTSELSDSKMAVKRRIKSCTKTHSDAMKDEFENHPETEKYKRDYEMQLLPVLEGMAKEADAWVAREKANVKQTVTGEPVKVTTNSMTDAEKETYDALKADLDKMMAAAETEAEAGNIDGSKFKVMLADEIKEKVQEMDEKYFQTFEVTHRGEDVCEICGTRYEALTATNHARHAAHFQGKVHLGYVKIRDWIADLKKGQRRGDDSGGKRDVGVDERDGGRRERRRSRSRREQADRPRESDRRRSRSRRDREPDRGRREPERDRRDGDRGGPRQRSRSRGERRGRGRD